MPDLSIEREHTLGLAQARKLARRWVQTAQQKLAMECTYEEGRTCDVVRFARPGVDGELRVTRDRFELQARLGFLLGAFKGRIESEIVSNLDELLAHDEPIKAFDERLAQASARLDAKKASGTGSTRRRKA